MSLPKRTLLIALDGHDPEIADRFIRAGSLPNLARLQQQCACIPLDHGIHRYSGLAMEHVSTGQGPDLSGRWSAVHFDPQRYTIYQPDTRAEPFPAGLPIRTVVFDAPYFDISRADNASGLVGWGAHDAGIPPLANPPTLADEIRERFGDYAGKRYIYSFTWPNVERTQQAGEALCAAALQRADIVRWLLEERLPEWDLAYVVWSEPHSIVEAMWHGLDATHPLHGHASAAASADMMLKLYQAVDAGIGNLLEAFPDADIVLFSMHGMGTNNADVPAMLLLPEFMYRLETGKSILKSNPDWAAQETPMLAPDDVWGDEIFRCMQHQDGLFSRLRRRFGRARKPAGGKNLDWMPASHYQRYWSGMKAFALPSFYDGRIRINLQGREAQGQVAPADYAATCAAIADELRACINPRTGKPAIQEVHTLSVEEALRLNNTGADMQILWADNVLAMSHPRLGQIGPVPIRRPGGHTGGHGVAYLRSEKIAPGNYATDSSLNVLPTTLDMLGIAKPPHFSGRSMINGQGNS